LGSFLLTDVFVSGQQRPMPAAPPLRRALATAVASCFTDRASAQTALATGQTMDSRMDRPWEQKTSHAFTARMCAASRYLESQRPDALFVDPLAPKLAGPQGLAQPMGEWIMVPRTRFGDDLVNYHYTKRTRPCRQLVLLGAGMDARAFRLRFPELRIFEVDLPILFDEKEPLLQDEQISVLSRTVVPTDFSSTDDWAAKLLASAPSHVSPRARQDYYHFDPSVPTIWLLEGLMMYLTEREATATLRRVGSLSAPGSAIFFDAVSAAYIKQRIVVGGAPFLGGSDRYSDWLRDLAGFTQTQVWDFGTLWVDRAARGVSKAWARTVNRAEQVRGKNVVLFVESEKP